jgi:hypothetical protein
MKNIIIAILLSFCYSSILAQLNYDRADFENINKVYAQLNTLQTEVDYVYYSSHSSKVAGETLKAVLSINGADFHYKLGDVETLYTSNLTIIADHEEKKIMLDRGHNQVRDVLFGANLDTLLTVCHRIKTSFPSAGIKKYELYANLAETERIDIYFDSTTFLMQKVVLFYNEPLRMEYGGTGDKPRLELVYRRQDRQPKFAPKLFDIDRFVQKTNKGYQSSPTFRNYKIIDNTPK